MSGRRRAPRAVLGLLALLALVAVLSALALGSAPLPPATVWAVLSGEEQGLARDLVLGLRLPRALAGLATGALLGLAGGLLQVLLRNPLAEPYVLGVSGGAAVGALGALLLGLAGAWPAAWAFAGAVTSMLLVFGLARGEGAWTGPRLLLTGVVVASGWGAAVSLLLALAPHAGLRGMVFWLLGDLSHAADPWLPLTVLGLGLALALVLAPALNLLAHGELQAAALGVGVRRVRAAVYLLASLLTAVAVTTAGTIGFVGLVVPHLVRLAAGSDQRVVLPGAALAGGALLVLADTAARTAVAPRQLPVGVVTALIGVPLFLYLLRRTP